MTDFSNMPNFPQMRDRAIDRAVTWLSNRLHWIVLGAGAVFVLYLIFGVTAAYALYATGAV